MELTELSLAPTQYCVNFVDKSTTSGSLSESENNPSKKRKFLSDFRILKKTAGSSSSSAAATIQTSSVDLQLQNHRDPLPLDWEQCLDLQSGRMYYLNRKTLRKSWNWPADQKKKLDDDLELELNNTSNCFDEFDDEYSKQQYYSSSKSSSNMVALACLNCHLLVILSKSSPSCPNCKYVHSIAALQTQSPNPKSLMNTLNLTD